MNRFRKLVYIVVASGAIAGVLLFGIQHFTTFPLIAKAEVYESAAEKRVPHSEEHEAWQPGEGLERTAYTAMATIGTSIGFAFVFWGTIGLAPVSMNWRIGILWGFAAFTCVNLAPAVGLPPQPPGTPVAELYSRQIWWVSAVVTAAIGLWLLLRKDIRWYLRLAGVPVMVAPHLVGAPTIDGPNAVPAVLIREFALASILSMACFWVVLGAVGGFLYERTGYARQNPD